MYSHRLILKDSPPDAEWLLEWDDTRLVLMDPEGKAVIETEAARAHRVVGFYELFAEGKLSFDTPQGSLTFKKDPAAVSELGECVETRLRTDAEYRGQLRKEACLLMLLGLAMFLVAGGPFALYCWFASWAPDPPPGHWIRWVGPLIHGVLCILLAIALAGPWLCYRGIRQWLIVRRIERAAAEGGGWVGGDSH